jgi:hypothetical protein
MRTLVALLVLSTASLVGAQVWVAPPGIRRPRYPGTVQNPYFVYDYRFPIAQFNTPLTPRRARP